MGVIETTITRVKKLLLPVAQSSESQSSCIIESRSRNDEKGGPKTTLRFH